MKIVSISSIIAVLFIMLVRPEKAKSACDNFALGLKKLVDSHDSHHQSRACLICDRNLEWNDTGYIGKKRLKSLRDVLSGKAVLFDYIPNALREYYTYARYGSERWMKRMFLSPRGVFDKEKGFNCCQTCCEHLNNGKPPNRVKLPRHAIANGVVIGNAPKELTDLNDTELALVAQARTDKHVFTYYGGAHKSMRGWHNLYENDLEHEAGVLQQLDAFGAGADNLIACVLQGPFTSFQIKKVKERVMIRPNLVLRAMRWLKRNNKLYKDLHIPTADELPKAIIIDESEHVESENTDIESRFEYSVVFPGTEEINSTNGGSMSQEEFRREVIHSMDRSNDVTLISRPTQNRVRDYEGDALMRAFPLQFPYGYGLLPTEKSGTVIDQTKIKMDDLFHLLRLSIRHNQRGDFILVLHNMYERHRAVNVSYLRCLHKVGDDPIADHFANMTVAELQSAINRTRSGLPTLDPTTGQYLRSVDAVCKSMGHTNEAAKGARLKLFANTVRFGPGSVFLTVTPDDGNCFRIKVYATTECEDPPFTSDNLEDIEADFEMTHQIRQEYPGFCAFDFDQITGLLIEHVLGWDQTTQSAKPGGGAFGMLDAWSVAVEEQGRKTLHGHYILWLKEWSSLLKKLRSNNEDVRKLAKAKLKKYIDTVLSTKLFRGSDTLIQTAYRHDCKTTADKQPIPEICNDQDIRNLRYKHGESSLGRDNFLKCPDCDKVFNMDELVNKVLSEWFGTTDNLQKRMKLAVKRYSAQIDDDVTVEMRVMQEFMIHALNNLHASNHVHSCFKKGYECRNKIPDRPCIDTTIHIDEENKIAWWSWNGTEQSHAPFITEVERHHFDIFMNRYHNRLSEILGSNTNVQCGIDGGHMMYATYYTSKGTQAEDKLAYCQVAKTLYARMRRQEDAQNNPENSMDTENVPTPFTEGYRRLLSAVLSHTQGHVVSAPMAWFIMRRGSRFLFSSDFGYVGLEGIVGRKTKSRIVLNKRETFLDRKLNDYDLRPNELELITLYDFIMQYDVKYKSKNNEDDIMDFQTEHPQSDSRGVINRIKNITPLVSYLDFPNTSNFGGNILDPNLEPNPVTEKYAKCALSLFVPFRDHTQFLGNSTNGSYTERFRMAIRNGDITEEKKFLLQNIQDCHNMMNSGRLKDILERTTEPLNDPIGNKQKTDEETDPQIAQYIEDCLTELISQLDEDNNISGDSDDDLQFMTLDQLRGKDKGKCGYSCIATPNVDENETVYVFKTDDGPSEQTARSPSVVTSAPKIVSKQNLTRLGIESIKRNVENITELEHINPNGSVQSIQKWAKIAFRDPSNDTIDETQQRAFEVIVSTFVLTFYKEAHDNEGFRTETNPPRLRANYIKLQRQLKQLSGMDSSQLVMFLTGAGGAGKTQVINSVLAYAKGFCKNLNYIFDKRTIVVTAMSGVAATIINGETTHSAIKKQCDKITVEHQKEWENTRMVIIDEISFATASFLMTLNEKLGLLKQTVNAKYGGLHVIFTGDFSQLEPVNGKPLYYQSNFAQWHDWVNCFIELTGQHRFKNDPYFGKVMKRIREGCPTQDDIDYLNTRIINGNLPNSPTMADVPKDVSYAVYENADRVAINNGVFAEHIKATHSTNKNAPVPKHTLIVRSDDITTACKSNKKPLTKRGCNIIWKECGDTDVLQSAGGDRKRKKYVDTFLKLYTGIPLMYMENTDVPNGKANGTLCYLASVHLHKDVTDDDFELMNIDGVWVRTVDASKVDYLLCRFADTEKTFKVFAQTDLCQVNMPIELIPGVKTRHNMKAHINRFPVLPNNCTTGHKLQGQTKESLFISKWNHGKNWPYVVLSRVKELSGLFLRTGIDPKYDFSLDPRLTDMIARFRRTKQPRAYEPD